MNRKRERSREPYPIPYNQQSYNNYNNYSTPNDFPRPVRSDDYSPLVRSRTEWNNQYGLYNERPAYPTQQSQQYENNRYPQQSYDQFASYPNNYPPQDYNRRPVFDQWATVDERGPPPYQYNG